MISARDVWRGIVSGLLLAACEPGAGPCALDYLGCNDGAGTFQLDPSCTLTGPLTVQLGHGDGGYSPLPEGTFPAVHHGPQGGSHVFMGLRVEGPEAGTVTALEATFELRRLEPTATCTPPGTRSPVDVPEHGSVCSRIYSDRTVVLGVRSPLRRDGEAIEEYGLTMVGVGSPSYPWWFSVTVRDQCGRTGTDVVWSLP